MQSGMFKQLLLLPCKAFMAVSHSQRKKKKNLISKSDTYNAWLLFAFYSCSCISDTMKSFLSMVGDAEPKSFVVFLLIWGLLLCLQQIELKINSSKVSLLPPSPLIWYFICRREVLEVNL